MARESASRAVARGASASSLEELCRTVDAESAGRLGDLGALHALLERVWDEGRSSQQEEIATLKRQLEAARRVKAEEKPREAQSFGEAWQSAWQLTEEQARSDKAAITIEELFEISENRTALSSAERRERARALSRSVFRFLRGLRPSDADDENEGGSEAAVAVPGEGVVDVDGGRLRLRLLERHEAAACVEYRIFGEMLAASDELASAGAVALVVDGEAVAGNVTGFFGRWARASLSPESWEEMLDSEEDDEIRSMLQSEGDDLIPWLDMTVGLLVRSAKGGLFRDGNEIDLEEVSGEFSLFPLLLTLFAFRQGNLELYTVYYLMRVLAARNAEALAAYEGRDVPARPDQLVSAQEAAFVQKTQADALSFVGFSVLFTWLLATAITFTLFWQLGGAVVDTFGLAGAAPDPLAF
jgi:hypothetical protein